MRRATPEEVERIMVPRLVDAIYPVLIPIEQQDMAIQARNHAQMVMLAAELWQRFCEFDK